MKLEQSFTVTAPVEQVWATLIDVERVAPCLPGAEITGQSPDGGYEGTFTVKLGPATAAYRGSLKMESLDEESRKATMSAKGTDKRGQGGATASIVSTMHQEGDDTLVEVVTDFTITGRLASDGLKYQLYRPASAPPGPAINPSSEIAMSNRTSAKTTPLSLAVDDRGYCHDPMIKLATCD